MFVAIPEETENGDGTVILPKDSPKESIEQNAAFDLHRL